MRTEPAIRIPDACHADARKRASRGSADRSSVDCRLFRADPAPAHVWVGLLGDGIRFRCTITGNVGVAFNGIRFDGPAPTDAILAAYTIAAFDDCGGHINPPVGYHYHAVTTEECLTTIAQDDGHAGMIGYAMDGFPMYEMLDSEGREATDLDGCRGHTDDVRGYHYHVSGPGENMILGCWSGLVVQGDEGGGGGGEAMDCATPDATMCCGDGVCDGPETAANCADDC